MMSTAPPLQLTHEQASRLHHSLEQYRCSVLLSQLPSSERNTTLRLLQSIQGKVVALLNQTITPLTLVLTHKEQSILKTAVLKLLYLIAQQTATPRRYAALADLADLKVSLFRSI